jgi:hypothetical protein
MDPCWGFDVTKSGLGLVFPTPHRKAFTVNAPLCGVGFLEPSVDTTFGQGVSGQASRTAPLVVFILNNPWWRFPPALGNQPATTKDDHDKDYKDADADDEDTD